MVKHLVCDDFLAGDSQPEEAAKVRRPSPAPILNGLCLCTLRK